MEALSPKIPRQNSLCKTGPRFYLYLMILWFAMILIAVAYRVATPYLGGLSNFAPLMAITLCAAVYLPRKWAFAVPFIALLISDLILNSYYHTPLFQSFMLATYSCYLLSALMGLWISRHKNAGTLLGGCLASTLLFYVATNTLAWAADPSYAQSFGGWLQALTIGDRIHQPATWVFLRNSLVSDLIFTALFAGCMEWSAARHGSSSQRPFPEAARTGSGA
jgi:hypothetical protein